MPNQPFGISVDSNGKALIHVPTDKTPLKVVTSKPTNNGNGSFSFTMEFKEKKPKKQLIQEKYETCFGCVEIDLILQFLLCSSLNQNKLIFIQSRVSFELENLSPDVILLENFDFYSVFYFVFWSFYLHILSRVAHHPLVAPLVRFNLSLLVWTRVFYHKKVK